MFLLKIIMINFKVFNKEFSQDFFLNKKSRTIKGKDKIAKKAKKNIVQIISTNKIIKLKITFRFR